MGKNYISVSGAVEVVPGAECDDIYTPQLVFSTNQNDLGPVGSDRQTYLLASLWILKSSADINLTGLQGGRNGRIVKLLNLGSFTISLVQENAGSQALNRFNFAQDLAPGEGATIEYSQALGRWFQPQTPGSGGGGGAPTTPVYLLGNAPPGSLPNARQLLAGTNVTFDDSTPGERTVNATGGGGGAPDDATYLLSGAVPGTLANARRLLAGTNITFDDSVPGARTINASGGGGGGMTLIGSAVADGSGNTLSVTGIPNTFHNIRAICVGRSTDASLAVDVFSQFNGDTTGPYDIERIYFFDTGSGTGQAVTQTSMFAGQVPGATATANRVGTYILDMPEYAGTTFDKQGIANFGVTVGTGAFNVGTALIASNWRPASPAAITSVQVFASAGNFAAGSVLRVYGY